ncbi:hypothetical protein TNCT_36571 [Trichonephila clavata]|uniref:Uncharacterized protein n=1 Tax=Trichonephila clavata TaxID=2740835 RepID=A0A8X6KUP6_TRICU|nr:hypothetical protein TNCT_36571 [Trichonephila clavata]
MDSSNLNKLLDNSDVLVRWSSKLQAVVENVEKCIILWRHHEKLFSSVSSEFYDFPTQDLLTEVSELEEIRADIHETEVELERLYKLIKSMRHVQDSTKKHMELFDKFKISNIDCRYQVRHTDNLIELLETMVLLICSTTNHVENAITGIKDKMHVLTRLYSATDTNA